MIRLRSRPGWSTPRLAPGIPRMLISNGRLPARTLLRRLLRCGAHGLSVHWRAVRSVKYRVIFTRAA